MDFIYGLTGKSATIEILLKKQKNRKKVKMKSDKGDLIKVPVYSGMDTIAGTIFVKLQNQKKLDHLGIKIELIGEIDMLVNKNESG